MKRFAIRVLPAVALLLVVGPLVGQQRQRQPGGFGGFGGGLTGLLTNKGVQEELKISDEQKSKLKSAVEDIGGKYKDDLAAARKDKDREKSEKLLKAMGADVAKAAEGTLKPEQMKRLRQIEIWAALQNGNLQMLTQERVNDKIKLTEKQKDAIKEASDKLGAERREIFQNAGGNFEEARKKVEEKTKAAVDKFMDTLSADQKSALKELAGEKFEVKFERRRPQQ
jgi:hypothetical protein